MIKVIKLLHTAIKSFDFFPNKQFIRYEHQIQYKTATGGTLSLTIIIIFTILFLNNGFKTLRKQLISSSYYTQYDSNPTPIDINIKDKSWNFAIFIPGINITDPSLRWFDITATNYYIANAFEVINATNIPLVPCTAEYAINDQIRQSYIRYKDYSMLCPDLNSTIHFEGKPISSLYSYLDIRIKKCNSSLHSNCAPDALIQQMETVMKQWMVSISLTTPVINPSNSEYKSYIIEDRNIFYFTTMEYGVSAKGYLQGFSVDTDQSIFPKEDHQVQTGGLVSDLFSQTQFHILNTSGYYFDLTIAKSPSQTIYSRSFQKLDQYLSYVGGLIGIVVILFFIMNYYTESVYSLSLAAKIFTYKQKEVEFQRYNFLYFIALKIMNLFKYLRCSCSWQIVDQFISCKEEIQKQIDITFILKRIKYLQNAITVILDQHQYETLHLSKKEQLQNAIYNRLLFQQNVQPQLITQKDNNEVANQYKQQYKDTPCQFQMTPQNTKAQETSEVIFKNQSLDHFRENNTKMTRLLKKLVKEAQCGDPISCKVAQKIGMDVMKKAKTQKTQTFTMKVQDYELQQNKSNT